MCHCEVFFVSFATSNKQRQSFEFDAMQNRIYPCDVCDGAEGKLVLADACLSLSSFLWPSSLHLFVAAGPRLPSSSSRGGKRLVSHPIIFISLAIYELNQIPNSKEFQLRTVRAHILSRPVYTSFENQLLLLIQCKRVGRFSRAPRHRPRNAEHYVEILWLFFMIMQRGRSEGEKDVRWLQEPILVSAWPV